MSASWIEGREEVDAFASANLASHPEVHVPGCPACGGAPRVRDAGINGSGPYRIQCALCGLRTPESTCIAGPLAVWVGSRKAAR